MVDSNNSSFYFVFFSFFFSSFQLEYEQRENDKLHKEIEKLEKRLLDEKERHKSIVLFLINERKQLLLNMYELKMRNDSSGLSFILVPF